MGSLARFVKAWRRVGFIGIIKDLRWRLNTLQGGHSTSTIPTRTVHILREGGIAALIRRTRYAVVQLRQMTHEPTTVAPPPHPWTQTAAHMVSFAPYFDLSARDLSTNAAIVERFDDRTDQVETATWFLPYFHHALFGGIHTILRLMDYMTRQHGVEHRVVVMDPEESHRSLRSKISAIFPSLEGIDLVLVKAGNVPYDELPHSDIAICTLWTTAFALARYDNVDAKYYMVQDYEPSFYPAGSMYGLTDATYRLGFAGIVNTPGVAEIYAGYGNPTVAFTPAFDLATSAGHGDPDSERTGPVQIVLYGRPSIDRNAFELVSSACVALKKTYGEAIRIVSAGEEFEPEELNLGGILENRGLLTTIEEVQKLYLESDIGICFMFSRHPSYQPFEYLAAGVAPVANVNASTSWFLRDGENCLVVEPYPSMIAEAVGRLIENEQLRESIVERGQQELAEGNWKREFDRIWSFVTGSTS